MELSMKLWIAEDQRLLERLKEDIVSGPTLKIPKSHQRFYINAYWSKGGMGAVLLQAKYSLEVIN